MIVVKDGGGGERDRIRVSAPWGAHAGAFVVLGAVHGGLAGKEGGSRVVLMRLVRALNACECVFFCHHCSFFVFLFWLARVANVREME